MTSSTPQPSDSGRAPSLALVQQGWSQLQLQRPLAAWAAWQRALREKPDARAAVEALGHLEASDELPAAARRVYRFQTPQDPDRRGRWDRRFRGKDLGRLDDAVEAFAALASEDPSDGAAAYNEALCLAWLGRNAEAIGALDRAVRILAVADLDRAVEAWTLAEVLRQGAGAETLADDLRYAMVFDRPDREVVARLTARVPLEAATPPVEPPSETPRSVVEVYDWLDRPLPDGPVDPIDAGGLPRVLATLIRGAGEIRLSSPDPLSLDEIEGELSRAIGDPSSTIRREASPLPLSLLDAALWRFRLPQGLDRESRERLTREAVEAYYEDRWIHIPRQGLGGRSPLEAARSTRDDAVALARLTAVIRLREQLGDRPRTAALYQGYPFDRLRRRLGLEPIDPAALDLDDMACMSEAELDRLDPAELDDVRLADAYRSASGLRVDVRTARYAAELVRRNPASLARLDLESLFAALVRRAMAAHDPAEALSWLDRAIGLASGTSRRTFNIWRAEILARGGDPEAALSTYESLLGQAPSDVSLALDAAETLIDQGYAEHARPLLLHALDQAQLQGDATSAERAREVLDAALA